MGRIDLFRIIAARFLSRVGSEAAFFVGVWGKAAFELDATAADLAVLMVGLTLATMLGGAVAGVLVDRHGPRVVLALAELAFVPTALAFIWADSMAAVTAIAALWAFVGTPVYTAGDSFAPYLTDRPEELKRVNSLLNAAGSLSFVLGPAAGALIARYLDLNWVFVFDAATSIAAAAIVWRARLRRVPEPARGPRRPVLAEMAAGVRVAYRMRALRYYIIAGTLAWVSFSAFGVLEPLFFRDIVRSDVEVLGWVNAFFGLGMLAGSALLTRMRPGVLSARGLAVTIVVSGFGSIIYVGTADLRVVYGGALLWGVVIGVLEPLLRTLIHRDTPHEVVGRVIGTVDVHRRAGELIPLAFAPAVAGLIGIQFTMIAGALLASAAMLASYGEARSIDRELGHRPVPEGGIAPITPAEEPVSHLP
ncbi:MAG TPA: MFS transporter [Coriobacteriia bacterium]|nr:MFS transporter [Coriobacteriia bacterium]